VTFIFAITGETCGLSSNARFQFKFKIWTTRNREVSTRWRQINSPYILWPIRFWPIWLWPILIFCVADVVFWCGRYRLAVVSGQYGRTPFQWSRV